MVGRDQGPRGHVGEADAPGNRRFNPGIAQVGLRHLHTGARGLHFGLGNAGRRLGVFVLLGADGGDFHQLRTALRLQLLALKAGLRLGQRRLGAAEVGLQQGGINLVQRLPLAHQGPLGKQLLLNNAAHLGPHLGHLKRPHTARQGRLQGLVLGLQHHHPHLGNVLRGGARWVFAPWATACEQAQAHSQAAQQRRHPGPLVHFLLH